MKKEKHNRHLPSNISRRDFVGGTLVGIGASLIHSTGLSHASNMPPVGVPNDPWTGYGGAGDYAASNGNVASVRDAAHVMLDAARHAATVENADDVNEDYDMVIIGGGFSGIGAAYRFHKKYGDEKKCLLLENHPVFGGEAKQNEFEVDGFKIYGGQGSNGFGPPQKDSDGLIADIYRDAGIPFDYEYVTQDFTNTKVRAPLENFYGMYWEEERYDTGYYMGADADTPWVFNPRRDHFRHMPWTNELKAEMNRVFEDSETFYTGDDFDRWLDSMTYKDLLEKVMGFSPAVTKYFDPIIALNMGGVCADVYSAYSAKLIGIPGTHSRYKYDPNETDEDVRDCYPGGNTGIYRHIAKHLLPESIKGGSTFEEILFNPIDFAALDRPKNPISIRLNSTAIDVRHAGASDDADHVNVAYLQEGKAKKIRTKTVVMSIGGWVARNIVSDMPATIREAYNQFHHAPVLVVNVALRNWRFLDKLGISSGRWFEGSGAFFSVRRPMVTGKSTQPFDPEKPIVMTIHIPFNYPGHSIKEQGTIGRNALLGKSYRDYEAELIGQMTNMFASAGFRAERDIAGIVLNRWGHAYISPQPGFHFGVNGNEAPKEVVRQGFGRIQFGHSELTGYMNYWRALTEGGRAASRVMEHI